jgi:hypothetical protein
MLALFFAICIETMIITIAIQISSQGRESFLLFHLGGRVIGPIVNVIVVGVIFVVVLAIYFRFTHADVKDKALFGIFFTAGIVLGLAMEAWSMIVADGVKNLALCMIIVFEHLVFLIGFFFFDSLLGRHRWDASLGFYVGWSLGYFMSLLLAVPNWGLHDEEGARPKLLCITLAFFLATYFLVAIIAFAQKEVKDDNKEDEVQTLLQH